MNTKVKVIGSFLIGAAVGAVSGILFAPYSGRKTRKKIKNESMRLADDLIDKANESLATAKRAYNQKLEEYAKTGKAKIDNLSDAISAH